MSCVSEAKSAIYDCLVKVANFSYSTIHNGTLLGIPARCLASEN